MKQAVHVSQKVNVNKRVNFSRGLDISRRMNVSQKVNVSQRVSFSRAIMIFMGFGWLSILASGCVPALLVGGTAAGYYVGQDERTLNEIVDDASITAGINARFVKDSTVSSWDINVETRLGVVMLYGNVSSAAIEQRAIDLAKEAKGVKKIISRLTIVERK